MKVLLVNGSPNRKGCTYVALKQIQDTLSEENIDSEIYTMSDIRISEDVLTAENATSLENVYTMTK